MSGTQKMWGGRFEGGLHPDFETFNASLGFDCALAEHDLRVNIAWAQALGRAEVLTTDEVEEITGALTAMGEEWEEQGVLVDGTHEDIHSFVEHHLKERVGDLAKKLHTGRSRNDQVATDLKLYLFERVGLILAATQDLIVAMVDLAERHSEAPMPGYTHLQRAQPVTIGHHALAYVEMLDRDRGRLIDLWRRGDTCPLGSAALAGTAFPIDREALAEALDFSGGPTRNSMDAASDRDHALEALFACSMIMTHLSRLAEDWIFFSSYEARFLEFSDAVATGSSLMPQKKNPDAMELIRGKCGRVSGHLHALLMTMKGLPLAYDKDLQEDKEGLFDALDQTESCLVVAKIAVETVRYDEERCRSAATRGYLNATDLADLCVREGMPFRDAHEAVGKAVRLALELGVELDALPEEQLQQLFPSLDPAVIRKDLEVDTVLARRSAVGGTSPERVESECARWREEIESWLA